MGAVESLQNKLENAISQTTFIDVNCWYDETNNESLINYDGFAGFAGWLRNKGILSAVFTNAQCIKYDPLTGNDNMERLINEPAARGLYGALVLTPEFGYDAEWFKSYIRNKIDRGFVAARFFPKKFYHSVSEPVIGALLSELEKLRFPIIFWHGETDFDAIHAICAQYPDLPVILEGNPGKLLYYNRNYYALLKNRNFYIETHGLIIFKEIEYIVSHFGGRQLLYGSYAPYNTTDVSISNLCLGVSGEDLQHIAGGNMRRLIGGIARK